MSQYAFGNVLTITDQGRVQYRYQNFFINKTASYGGQTYTFVPFGFSGVSVNRTGDGVESSLVFPSNDLTRSWGVNAVNNHWVMQVSLLIIDSQHDPNGVHDAVSTYVGQVVGGQWDNVSMTLNLGTILDAVGADIPRRSINRKLVGNLPITSNVRLQ